MDTFIRPQFVSIKCFSGINFKIVHVVERENSEWTTVTRIVYYPLLF